LFIKLKKNTIHNNDLCQAFKSNGQITTKRGTWDIEFGGRIILTDEVPRDPKLFSEMCRTGCKNYNKRHCCPPLAPSFDELAEQYEYLCYYYVLMKLEQLPSEKYFPKIWTANKMCRSRLERTLRIAEKNHPGSKLLVSGSCTLCKKCTKPENKPCKKPDKMRVNIGATGINVSELLKKCFDFPLEWVWGDGEFTYSIVTGGLLANEIILPEITIEQKI
jgi:predicted metal-binding protein